MPSKSASSRRTVPLWSVPVTAVALLGAVGGGLLAGDLYLTGGERVERFPESSTAPDPVGEPPGSRRVSLSDSAQRHPDSEAVQNLLQRHFNAINQKDYPKWMTTVVSAKRANQPRDQWLEEYDSTKDGTIEVHRIVSGPGAALRVVMSFISTQNPDDAPASMSAGCLRWRVVYQIVPGQGGLRLDQGLPNSSLHQRCDDS